ncbi:UvrD-helicase domain-containing protein [Caloramator sp. CAR-1]|uniref:UvrD-helicase domain-containing protein n=1 Tax=Caloramator sp. CAR-1 TaxID=3062777 RepID=UPI0026E25257|nr:UvrD-helicase domain-containing protein [Caloramator sp. CAR-1]MDO6355239.1 UvrD-helicase domain-containing protein [Caloramator sp. CAR-1]
MDLEGLMKVYGVNEEQAMALDGDKNIALHAGAGSGKTRVLTRRFLRILLEKDVNIRNVVAITFTKKAALEMKERIIELVNDFLVKEKDPETNQKLRKIKEDLPLANISTFHSFCDSILRENCYLLGIDPNYKIIEEVDELTILDSIIDDVIKEVIMDKQKSEIIELIIEEYGADYILKKRLNKELKELYNQIMANGDDFNNVLENTKGNIKKYKRDNLKDEDLIYEKINLLASELLILIDEKYQDYKKKHDFLDFNDLERLTLKLLYENEGIKENLHKAYKYFLIDEFQDTNDIQLNIIYKIVKDSQGKIDNGKMFVVGDIKQSIYLFRGADYRVFERVTEEIQKQGEKLNLDTNYRSHEKLIEVINKFFKDKLEGYEEAKIPEDKFKVKGECFVTFFSKGIEKDPSKKEIFLNEVDSKEDFEKLFEREKIKDDEELNYISSTIKELVEKGISYRDIAILVRKNKSAKVIEEKLKQDGIPYSILNGAGFFESKEILDIINILKFMFEYNNTKALIGILRSPFIGASDDIILQIFKGREYIKKEDILSLDIINKNSVLKSLINKIFDLKEKAYYYNLHDFIKLIIQELNIDHILLSSDNGLQKYRNIEKFISIAKEFDDKGIFSSGDFLDYIENLMEISDKEGQAFLDTEDSDAVKIMSVHASKGLEFEAVFLPMLNYDLKAKYDGKFIYDRYGINGIRYGIAVKMDGKEGLFDELLNIKKEEESKEELRILYVGATRAKRFLSFSWKESGGKGEKIYQRINGGSKNGDYIKLQDVLIDVFKGNPNNIPYFDDNKQNEKINEEKKVKILFNEKVEYIPKPVISVSRYLTYKDCPRKYFYKYIANIDERHIYENIKFEDIEPDDELKNEDLEDVEIKLNSLDKGILIHSILEDIVKKEIEFEEIEKNYILEDEIKGEVKKLINNFNKIEEDFNKNIKGERVRVETEFLFRLPLNDNVFIAGVIDRIDIYKDDLGFRAYLIDYKTNKIKGKNTIEDIKKHYKPQFMVYSYAFEEIFKDIKLEGMYLYLLDKGEIAEINFSKDEREEVLKDISKIFSGIEKKNKFEDFTPCSCYKGCGYKILCSEE